MRVFCLTLLILVAVGREYPLYNQCDPKWRNDHLGFSTSVTICEGGAIISSVAMALTALGQTYTPQTLNQWLKSHKGYIHTDEYVWNSTNPLGMTYQGKVPNALIRINLDVGYIVIINVNHGSHWVLATSFKDNTIYVHDSLHTTTKSYEISTVYSGHTSIYKVPISIFVRSRPLSFLEADSESKKAASKMRVAAE